MARRFAEDISADLALTNREPHGARITLRLPYPGLSLNDQNQGARHA
jgi:hypothetical protein